MRDLEIPVEPVSDRDHCVVRGAIFAIGVPEAFRHQDGDTELAEDVGAPAEAAAGKLLQITVDTAQLQAVR